MSQTKDTNPKSAFGDTKISLVLCSPIAKAIWATAQFLGLTKYGAWNWRVSGVRASTYISAIGRHLDAFVSGEENDPVDGTDHLGAIMASAAIIIDARAAGKLNDDRPPSVSLRSVYAAQEALMPQITKRYEHMSPVHMTIKDTQPTEPSEVWVKDLFGTAAVVGPSGSAMVTGPFGFFSDRVVVK